MKNMEITVAGNTYRTSEYEVFQRLEGNRKVLAARVSKIRNSIVKNGYIFNPIVVNEKYQVIDGQGRLEALSSMGLPVDFVIAVGAGLEQCVALNASGKIWTIADYIDSYCEMGNRNYLRFREIASKYPEFNHQLKVMIITGLASSPNNIIKEGRMELTAERAAEADDDLAFLRKFIPAVKRTKGNQNRYYYAIVFARRCGVDCERLLRNIEKAELPPAADTKAALNNLSDLYNIGLSTPKRIYLVQQYETSMASKYGWYYAKWGSEGK